ncbi:MAG: histidine kinase, partial [Owenweeksia sp.]
GFRQEEFTIPAEDRRPIRAVVYDKLNILVADQKGAIWKVDQNGKWDTLNVRGLRKVNDLLVIDKVVWIATPEGLMRSEGGRLTRVDTLEVKKLCKGGEDKEIFALSTFGLRVFDPSGKIIRSRPTAWKDIFIAPEYHMALGKGGEVVIRNPAGRILTLDASNGLPQLDYKGCYIDDNHVIWFYSNKGLVKLETLAWQSYAELNSGAPQVFAVYQQGNDYFAGLTSGYAMVNNGSITLNKKETGFPYGLTLSIETFDGDIWLGTENGLIRNRGGIYREIRTPGGGDFVFAMKNARNRLWLGMGAGLFSYSKGRVENVSNLNDLPPATVFAISEGGDGSLWCGTYTQGFFRYADERWEVLRELNGVRLDSLRFSCFAAVNKDEIWAGSLTEGIFHFNKKGVERIPVENLEFAEIQSMAVASDNTVWVGTNKGIFEVRKGNAANIIKLPYSSDLSGQSCTPQAMVIQNNKLLVGTTDGFQVLNLYDYQKQRPPPRLILTDIKMFLGQNTSLPEYANDSIPFTLVPSEVQLPHDLNFLSFNLAGLTSYQQENLQYRYRLVGQSEQWTMAGGRREAIFSNIKPGYYTFEAQVSRLGEGWSSEGVEYKFQILRPIWLRWWFIAISCLLLGGLSFIFISDRIKRANQRLRLENDLLDMERKALRLQMNPHFIFNALDSISSFIFKKDPEKAVRYLNNFAKLMRLTLESSMEHLHPVETEVSILKNYLELEKLRFQGKFEYDIEVDDEIDYDVGIPPMLIQPHVENAILHGLKPLKDSGYLNIRFILNEDLLVVEVEDNGIGRKKAKELHKRKDHRSMATQINRDRLRLLRKSMSEKVDITITDKVHETGEAAGTMVVIKLPAESI